VQTTLPPVLSSGWFQERFLNNKRCHETRIN